MAKPAKTSGIRWLGHSLASFNGTGYADRTSAEDFIDSYTAYKQMCNDDYALNLTLNYRDYAEEVAKELLAGPGPSKKPNPRTLAKFEQYYPRAREVL